MNVSQQDLLQIVEQSSTIPERLSQVFTCKKTTGSDATIQARLERWCQVAARGDWEKFVQRLAWDGEKIDTIRRVLGAVELANTSRLPAWSDTLQAVINTAYALSPEILETTDPIFNPEHPIPFELVFLPCIRVARQQLANQASCCSLLNEATQLSLESSLIQNLIFIFAPVLDLEFSVFRNFTYSSLSRLLGQVQGNSSNELYNAFITKLFQDGLLAFFQEYTVVARLVATTIDFWVRATADFLQRLANDLPELQQTFNNKLELGRVEAVKTGLSDPHNQGQSVIALTFTTGLKLVYKPKDLGLDVAYSQLLDWLNQREEIELPFKVVKVLNRSGYGWVEFVEHLPCEDVDAVRRYYQRSGMLLCLIYALQGDDCHYENLIACGEDPALIDVETLMHHRAKEMADPDEMASAQFIASEQFSNSVLQSGLLPRWEFSPDNRVAYDISGLGGVTEQETQFHYPKWQYINTDAMLLSYESSKFKPSTNIVFLDGVSQSPSDYVDYLVAGFQQMYQLLLTHREALLSGNSPLTTLAHQRVRFVARATRIYGSIQKRALQPNYLRHGADYSIELDLLSGAYFNFETKPDLWSVVVAEFQAMAQLDIPYFTVYSDSDSLTLAPNLTLVHCFKGASYDLVLEQIRNLSEADLVQQVALIQATMFVQVARGNSQILQSAPDTLADITPTAFKPLTQETLLQEALNIAQGLKQRAIHAPDGSVTWVGLNYVDRADRFQLQVLPYPLYSGSLGVILFLAALEKVTGRSDWRMLISGVLQSFQQILQNSKSPKIEWLVQECGIGGGAGLGSIVYSLVQISQFLKEPGLIEDACQVAAFITPERVAQDGQFDVISGSAGAILGLLALYRVTADQQVLNQAVVCGQHLFNHRTPSKSGYQTWAMLNKGCLLTGFSHGAAGVAYALLRLYSVTQEADFLGAAQEAFAYERSVFVPQAGNWPDLRSTSPDLVDSLRCANSWCHGAPGIGLSRVGGLAVLDTPEIRQEINIALQTTQKHNLDDIDHLCCGNLGRMEILLVAAQKLMQPEYQLAAQQLAAAVVTRARESKGFQLFPSLNIYNPGFFGGMAGIGYALLRLAQPDALPSILLWE